MPDDGNFVRGRHDAIHLGGLREPRHLDHLSFSVPSRADLEQAVRLFDERGVEHGAITRLAGFGIDVLPFEDPDGIQLELTAPVAGVTSF